MEHYYLEEGESSDESDFDLPEDAMTSKNKLCKPRRVKGLVRSDGCILPKVPPRLEADGGFRRPAGRQPIGMEWDTTQGLWAPKSRTTRSVGKKPNDHSDSSSSEDEESSPNKSSSRKQSPSKRLVPHDNLHPRSMWRELDRDDGLTLYERHRKPRPVIRGQIVRPLKPILQEFRCVICLGCIHNARMVAECLHRFCEECIDRAMRVGQNRCPICRVIIPSRRSLAADPDFDRLVVAILGKNAVEADLDDNAESNKEHKVKAVTLQKAILRKKEDADAEVLKATNPEPVIETRRKVYHAQKTTPRQYMFSSVLDIALLKHEKEENLDQLDLPYLRLEERTTILTIKKFLSRKLARPDVKFQIGSYSDKGKPVIFTDWMTLAAVANTFASSSQSIVHLYYRIEPPRRRPGRAIFI